MKLNEITKKMNDVFFDREDIFSKKKRLILKRHFVDFQSNEKNIK